MPLVIIAIVGIVVIAVILYIFLGKSKKSEKKKRGKEESIKESDFGDVPLKEKLIDKKKMKKKITEIKKRN